MTEHLGSPYVHVSIPGGEVRVLLGADDDPATVENCDGYVDVDGVTRTFSVLTIAEVSRLMARWEVSGEGGGGEYLLIPDLIILRRGGLASIVAAVQALAADLPSITLDD